jgi:hypothetical protein
MYSRQLIQDYRSQLRLLEKTAEWIDEFTYVGKPVPQGLYETLEKDLRCFHRIKAEMDHVMNMERVFKEILSLHQDECALTQRGSCY